MTIQGWRSFNTGRESQPCSQQAAWTVLDWGGHRRLKGGGGNQGGTRLNMMGGEIRMAPASAGEKKKMRDACPERGGCAARCAVCDMLSQREERGDYTTGAVPTRRTRSVLRMCSGPAGGCGGRCPTLLCRRGMRRAAQPPVGPYKQCLAQLRREQARIGVRGTAVSGQTCGPPWWPQPWHPERPQRC